MEYSTCTGIDFERPRPCCSCHPDIVVLRGRGSFSQNEQPRHRTEGLSQPEERSQGTVCLTRDGGTFFYETTVPSMYSERCSLTLPISQLAILSGGKYHVKI